MTKNYLNIMLLAFISAFSITQISAQEKDPGVKVVVIEKTIDKDGKETIEKTIKEGKEADVYVKKIEKEISLDEKKKDSKTITKKILIEGDDSENIMIIKSDGEDVIKWSSDDMESDELEELLKEHKISLDVESDDKGHMKIKLISDGEEEELIFIGDDHELSDEDYKVIVHKSMDDRKAQLGVMIQMPEEGEGVEVIDVFEDSGAEKAGIRKGDIIKEVNGVEVKSIEELVDSVKDREPGEEVKLLTVRDGEPTVRKVTMQEYQAKHEEHEEHEVIIIKKEH